MTFERTWPYTWKALWKDIRIEVTDGCTINCKLWQESTDVMFREPGVSKTWEQKKDKTWSLEQWPPDMKLKHAEEDIMYAMNELVPSRRTESIKWTNENQNTKIAHIKDNEGKIKDNWRNLLKCS